MDLQQFRIIQQAAGCDFNLTKVAQAMHTSQPGISRQLRALEDELGVELFIRAGKRLTGMTPPGREILDIACRIMADVRNIQGLSGRVGQSGGVLRLAADAAGSAVLPGILARFHGRCPEVRLLLSRRDSSGVAAELLRDDADIGLAGEQLRNARDLVVFPQAMLRHMVAAPASHPLARLRRLTLEALLPYPLLACPAGTGERVRVDNAFAAAGLNPKIALAAEASCLLHCARLGLGLAIVCVRDREETKARDLRFLEAGHLFEDAPLLLGIRRGKLLRDLERHYIQLLLPDMDLELVQQAVLTRDSGPFVPSFSI
jgi:LysR family cys regulon transcriptional activator